MSATLDFDFDRVRNASLLFALARGAIKSDEWSAARWMARYGCASLFDVLRFGSLARSA